ncbi:Z1 domain-containing protein [Nocardia sp. NPDC051321]|uniref:Z1 domain-containing protein n=1 Tax=Nocardia sp. NPDC051321 TaxID=3364323 RepID=UPI0037AE3CD1
MTESLVTAYLIALDGMKRTGPRDLNRKASSAAEDLDVVVAPSNDELSSYLNSANPNDELPMALGLALRTWDNARIGGSPWTDDTESNTRARRDRIYFGLNLDISLSGQFDRLFPIAERDGTIVIAESWDPWYTTEIQQRHNFYWDHYQHYLQTQSGWSAEAVSKLDCATTHVVERLSNPTGSAHQVKGLVVGYVQSGKTANFTGVIAKAVDAGYRLIIVLTGTTNVLREQTQRRLDIELVGIENILRGIDTGDAEALAGVDYQDDRKWANSGFVSHGCRPSDAGRPDIHRMTTRHFDYRSLQQGITALDFERRDRTKPLMHPDNLFSADARLVVVKKNKGVLEKLVRDLGVITTRLHQIPALIIDDESDQASINTSNPNHWRDGKRERTSINALISQLLGKLPRGQYVGYTATPFANVFVDPTDAEDIFPKSFLISLERPPGYMGAEDFHDLDSSIPPGERNFTNSKEKAHVRLLSNKDERAELLEAMDSFVLSGVVKTFLELTGRGRFDHHTMLVHEAMKTAAHRVKSDAIRDVWNKAGYLSTSCHSRLRELYEADILPVARALAPTRPIPDTFDDLVPYLGQTVMKICPGGNPVLVVNSDTDIEQEELNFSQHNVWRILVGGNKLARGFTVEGLTVSYYRREVKSADALMQMGRWFGFRDSYRDLVRLYVTPDLHDTFESICRDEEDFRTELAQFAEMVDGRPLVTPGDVAPVVSSHKLRPTTAAKMYNARLIERRTPNKEPSSGYPKLNDQVALDHNIDVCVPLLAAANSEVEIGPGTQRFGAFVGTVTHNEMMCALEGLTWAYSDTFAPDVNWLRSLKDRIDNWRIVIPKLKSGRRATLRGLGPFSLHGRTMASDSLRGNSTSAHRAAVDALRIETPRTGWLILYPVVKKAVFASATDIEADPKGVVLAISLRLPDAVMPRGQRPLQYQVVDSTMPSYSVIEG